MAAPKTFMDQVVNFAKDRVSTSKISGDDLTQFLHSNKSINSSEDSISIAKGFMGGMRASYENMAHNKMGIKDAVSAAHRTQSGDMNYAAIAGSYIGASAAYRVASGGGVTRDKDGNPNIIGLPFV